MRLKLPEKHKEKDTAAAPPLNQQRTAKLAYVRHQRDDVV